MNENLDLTEILRDCPKGTMLYSPLFGVVELLGVSDKKVIVETSDYLKDEFNANGAYINGYKNTECLLFPSKDNRDWATFKKPCEFQPFQKVLVRNDNTREWSANLFSHVDDCGDYLCLDGCYGEVIAYDGNEDKLGKVTE